MAQPAAQNTIMSWKNRRHCVTLAQGLGLSAIFPLIGLNEMFLAWDARRTDTQEDLPLSDSDHSEDEESGDELNTVRYTTEAEYGRRMKRISSHYGVLGVELMLERCPKLREHMEEDYDEGLIHEMAGAVSQTRANHTFNIRDDIISYLEPLQNPTLGIIIPARVPKTSRGLKHIATARFIIPRRHLDEFEGAPQRTIAKFLDGESTAYSLVAEEWPTFLYDELSGWSSNNVSKGLFRGHVLARVALRIYRNRTAVNNEEIGKPFDPKGSRSQGQQPFLKKYNITKVTPEMVAYAALQTYIGLSTAPWGEKDGTFNLIHFYHLIVKTLSNNEDQWVIDTLQWWQMKLFGDSSDTPAQPSKRLVLTKKTTYRLMEKQRRQGEDADEQGDESAMPEPTYPRWTQRGAGHARDDQSNDTSSNQSNNNQEDRGSEGQADEQGNSQRNTDEENCNGDQAGTGHTSSMATQTPNHNNTGGRVETLSASIPQPPITRPPSPQSPTVEPPTPQPPTPQPPSCDPPVPQPPAHQPPSSDSRNEGTTPLPHAISGQRRTRENDEDTEQQDGSNAQKRRRLQPPRGSATSEQSQEPNNVAITQDSGGTKPSQAKKGKGSKGQQAKKTKTAATRAKIPRNAKKGGKSYVHPILFLSMRLILSSAQ